MYCTCTCICRVLCGIFCWGRTSQSFEVIVLYNISCSATFCTNTNIASQKMLYQLQHSVIILTLALTIIAWS